MNNTILLFDCYSLFIVLSVALAFFLQVKIKNKYIFLFKIMLGTLLLSTIFEIISVLLLKNYLTENILFRVTMGLSFFFVMSFSVFQYAYTVLLFDNKEQDKTLFKNVIIGLGAIFFISLIGLFPNIIYKEGSSEIKLNNYYFLYFIVVFIYTILMFRNLYKNKKLLNRLKTFVSIMYLVFLVTIVILTLLYIYVPAINFIFAVYMLMLYISMYTSDNHLIVGTKIFNYSGFKINLTRKIQNCDYNRYYYIFVVSNFFEYLEKFSKDAFNIDKAFGMFLKNNFGNPTYKICDNRYVMVSKKNLDIEIQNLFFKSNQVFFYKKEKFTPKPIIASFKVKEDFNTANDIIYAVKSENFVTLNEKNKITKISKDILIESKKEIDVEKYLKRHIIDDDFTLSYRLLYENKEKKYAALGAYLLIKDENEYLSFSKLTRIAASNGILTKLENSLFSSIGRFVEKNDLKSLGINEIFIYITTFQMGQVLRATDLINSFRKYTNKSFSVISILLTEVPGVIDYKIMNENIKKLKDCGARVYLSEFGSGYSTLDFLFQCPFDGIKINRKITREAIKSEEGKKLLKYIINIGVDTKKDIFLAGVDSKILLNLPIISRVKYLGGSYFCSYKSEKDIINFIKEKRER